MTDDEIKFTLTENMTPKDHIESCARICIIVQWNERQKHIFKCGGIAFPTVKTWEEFEALQEILKKMSNPYTKRFDEMIPGKITFDLPLKYRNKYFKIKDKNES